jgi:aspartate kinase
VPETTRQRPVIVQKYGGSSVADVDKLGRVADRIVAAREAGNDVVVVVSAMGKATDGLIALAHSAAERDGKRIEPARRELDMLVSTGERVSMSLLSIAIQARGYDAISFTGSQSGIMTNDRHFDARIIEVRPHRIEDELHRGRIVIVAGYQGMSYKREITTLGRGGSDTTAVALAAALLADRCEIYSDVDGVYSADPRVVPDAMHIGELDHAILQEMAESGAKVVCAQAVEWARRKGITIVARSTFEVGRETVIRAPNEGAPIAARGVSAETKLAMATWTDLAPGDVIAALAKAGLTYKDLLISGNTGSVLLPLLNVPSPDKALGIFQNMVGAVKLSSDVASVSVVGDGLAGNAEPLQRFVGALGRADVPVLGVVAGPLRLTAVVPVEKLADAQRAVHAELVAGR